MYNKFVPNVHPTVALLLFTKNGQLQWNSTEIGIKGKIKIILYHGTIIFALQTYKYTEVPIHRQLAMNRN